MSFFFILSFCIAFYTLIRPGHITLMLLSLFHRPCIIDHHTHSQHQQQHHHHRSCLPKQPLHLAERFRIIDIVSCLCFSFSFARRIHQTNFDRQTYRLLVSIERQWVYQHCSDLYRSKFSTCKPTNRTNIKIWKIQSGPCFLSLPFSGMDNEDCCRFFPFFFLFLHSFAWIQIEIESTTEMKT